MVHAMRKGASSAFGARANGKKLAQACLLVCSQSLLILGFQRGEVINLPSGKDLTNSLLLNMAIGIVRFPLKNGDFP